MITGQLRRIRWAVRAVLALGITASVAANVLHAEPNGIAQTIAAWPPMALLLTVELISRVPVHRRWLAVVRMLATGTIAGIAAFVSYNHMVGVAIRYGETGAAPYLIPLSVDGLVVVASVCLVELGGKISDVAGARNVEVEPVALPAVDPAPVLVEPAPPAEPLPEAKPETAVRISEPPVPNPGPSKSSGRRTISAPRRSAEVTRRMVAALDADGMSTSQIAAAIGITQRAVRGALQSTPVAPARGENT